MSYETNPKNRCPRCSHGAEHASGAAPPNTGDIAICAYCSAVLVYTKGLRIREMTETEYRELTPEVLAEIGRATFVAAKFRRMRAMFSRN